MMSLKKTLFAILVTLVPFKICASALDGYALNDEQVAAPASILRNFALKLAPVGEGSGLRYTCILPVGTEPIGVVVIRTEGSSLEPMTLDDHASFLCVSDSPQSLTSLKAWAIKHDEEHADLYDKVDRVAFALIREGRLLPYDTSDREGGTSEDYSRQAWANLFLS